MITDDYYSQLPRPLDKDTEDKYLFLLLKGDEDARKKLIEHNTRLVLYIARRFLNTEIDLDELFSIGSIGLIKAVNTYKIEKNTKLVTYAAKCIENEILMFLRCNAKIKTEISLEEPVSCDNEGRKFLIEDLVGTDPDIVTIPFEKLIEMQLLYRLINNLASKQKTMIFLRYGFINNKQYTQRETALKIGISQSYLSRIERQILMDLKKELLSLFGNKEDSVYQKVINKRLLSDNKTNL